MPKCKTKAVVFDLDDTIGHFEQLSIFISALEQSIVGFRMNKVFFNKLLDLFPHFLRPGIIPALKYLKKMKKKDKCLKVIIYTNNNGPRGWTLLIKNYLEKKIKSPIFDRIITKYDRHSVINCRTTHHKTHADLLKCTALPKNAAVLFLDDQYHELMNGKNITYLYLNPYNFSIPPQKMISIFLHAPIGKFIPKQEQARFTDYMKKMLVMDTDYKVKKNTISRRDRDEKTKILTTIKKFTKKTRKTRKSSAHKRRKTRKNYF
jgi:hypothetical protein